MSSVEFASLWIRGMSSGWLAMVVCLYVFSQRLPIASGHGYIIDPPSRSSEWRVGLQNPINYNDNGLNCGGFSKQYNENGGKCGACGDPWDVTPRPNEVGGKYANGIIVRRYEVGQVILAKIVITAQHKGWHEFRLCPVNESVTPVTQQCLDRLLLKVDRSNKTRYFQPSTAGAGTFEVAVKLPDGISCDHCVLQWKWNVGNSWGVGSDGIGCIGCGHQEQFINCADIRILGNSLSSTPSATSAKVASSALPSVRSQSTQGSGRQISKSTKLSGVHEKWTTYTDKGGYTSPKSTVSYERSSSSPAGIRCRAIGLFKNNLNLDKWCENQCKQGFCPPTHCQCYDGGKRVSSNPDPVDFTICKSVGIWSSESMDDWCISNCAAGNCPPNYCQC